MSRGRALLELVLARWRSFYREPGAIFWTFGFPILLTLALGVAFRTRPPEPTSIAVVRSGGAEAPILDALSKSKQLKPVALDEREASDALRAAWVDVVVEPGPPRTYRYDPTRAEGRAARLLVDDVLQRADGRSDAFVSADRYVTEPGSRYVDFLLPGLIGMNLLSSGLWGVGYAIADMRSRKLIKRFVATPMRRGDFLLAFVFVRAFFLVFELPVLVGFGRVVFDVPMRGSLALFFAVATLGSLAFAGLGLLVAMRSQNIQTVNGLISLVTMPMFVLSGVFFSTARFPAFLQPALRVLPLTALNDALRAIMLRGAGPSAIAREVAIVAAWGAVAFAISLRWFRWR